jgi:hypothetical protein
MGAMTAAVIPWLVDRLDGGPTWQAIAWWIHDHLPIGRVSFLPFLLSTSIAESDCSWLAYPQRGDCGSLTRGG